MKSKDDDIIRYNPRKVLEENEWRCEICHSINLETDEMCQCEWEEREAL